jgi:hypothetical protein
MFEKLFARSGVSLWLSYITATHLTIAVFLTCVLQADGADKEAIKKAGAAWYKTMSSDSDYLEFEIFQKWLGASQT